MCFLVVDTLHFTRSQNFLRRKVKGKEYVYEHTQCGSKVRSIFSSLKFYSLLKIPFVKRSMFFVIHLTLNN